MDFDREFEADENDVEFAGEEQESLDFGDLGEVTSTSLGAEADTTDETEAAFDETFAPVEESSIAPDAAPVASRDAASQHVQPAIEGPYINAASIPDIVASLPTATAGIVDAELRNPADDLSPSAGSAASFDRKRAGDLSARIGQMFQPGYERGQPPVCPIVLVRMADDQMEQLVTETRKQFARELAASSQEVARHEVRQEFWRRDCELRAILGH